MSFSLGWRRAGLLACGVLVVCSHLPNAKKASVAN